MTGNKQASGVSSSKHSLSVIDGSFEVTKYGWRHQQCLIMFLTLATAYSMRACIGVALVAMLDTQPELATINSTHQVSNNTVLMDDTSLLETNITRDVDTNKTKLNTSEENFSFLDVLLLRPPYPKFAWSKRVQDVVIASFFWGYMTLQVPAGQLVHHWGPRLLLVSALSINCFVSFCFPWAAYYGGWIFAVVCRVLQGLSQACVIPGLYGFFGQWAPLEERSRLIGFAAGGQAIGTVLGLPMTGFIAASPLGWPGIFRFYGVLSGLVAMLVFFLVYDTPAQHPRISFAERKYIENALGLNESRKKKKLSVPWRHILRLPALYGIMIAHVSQTWGQIILFAEIPSFMNKVMHVDIKANGLLTALPFFMMWFANFFWNWFTDWIIVNKYLSVTNARKMANTIACVPAAIGLVVLAYAPKTVVVVESILIFICVFKISAHVGSMVTHVDIAPNFAGTMMSLSNFVSNLFGSQAPLVTGFLLNDVTSEYEWRKVFLVAAGLYFFTNVIYCVLGTAEKAPWNVPEEDDNSDDRPEKEPMIHNDKGKPMQ